MPQTEPEPRAEARSKGRRDDPGSLELYTTAFVCGAAVMTIEVVGTRIVGPVFGVGLYVWAALLAVTLASLSTGYYLGGQLADRRPGASLLARVVVMAGAPRRVSAGQLTGCTPTAKTERREPCDALLPGG